MEAPGSAGPLKKSRRKWPTTLLSPSMVSTQVVLVPEQSSLQWSNRAVRSADAVSVTTVPAGKVAV
jgi:hypothetical protein